MIAVAASLRRGACAGRVADPTRRRSSEGFRERAARFRPVGPPGRRVATVPRLCQGFLLVICLLAGGPLSSGAPLKSAHVSQVIRDVRLLPTNAAPRPAAVNDNLVQGTAVRTGIESRAELTFADLTITRLGENTVFSFREATRDLDVSRGAVLVEVPSKSPAAKINTSAVTAAVMGGTALFATGPPIKFMVLEGVGTLYPAGHPELAVTVPAGEMVMFADGRFTQPEQFNVKLVLETSQLIVNFPDLTNLPLILQVANQQFAVQSGGTSSQPPSKDPLTGVIDVVNQNVNANPAVEAFTSPPPTGSPSEVGPPSTITSPNPYVITSGTSIKTDTAITTNGVTSFGKIYHSTAVDGPLPTFLFGSTSAFDNTIKFGINIDPNDLPIAVFKFQSLSITGNPTIDLSNGGTTKLGLVAIDGITSGPPGGTLTFSGLSLLGLVTQAGSINLTSDISFQNIGFVFIYARGAGSTLTLATPILGAARVDLRAESSMQLMTGITAAGDLKFVAGGDLVTTGTEGNAQFEVNNVGGTIAGTRSDRGNITLVAGGNLSSQNLSLLLANNAGGNISGTGGNILVTTGGDLTTTANATFTIQNTTGTINNGGNVGLMVGGSISTPGVLSVLVENYDFSGNTPGRIGTGGNILVTTGGDLSAQSVNALINNRSGGQIGSPVNLTLTIGGALTMSGNSTDPFGFPTSLFVVISNRFDNTSGPALASTVGGDATLTINAGSASIGGNLITVVSNSGSTLNGNALLSLGITHDMSVQGEADMEILNDADSGTPLGGMLHGSATLQFASNNFTANALFTQIDNRDGAMIDSNAAIIFDLKGRFAIPGTNPGNPKFDATVPGEADIFITNQKRGSSPDSATSGGTIGGNALIQLAAASAFTAGLLDVEIDNFSGGTIRGNAIIQIATRGIGTTSSTAQAAAAGGVMANSLLVQINNNNGGSIGGNAAINMNVSGAATITSDATVQILGSNGAANGAAINFNGGSYNVGSASAPATFLSMIDGDGAITFNNASIHADVVRVGVFGSNGALNIGSGPISANTLLKLYAPGSNGILNFVANVTLTSGTFLDLAAHTITILPGVTVTIAGNGGAAHIYTDNPNYSGFGGNNRLNGTFAGNGANPPQPTASAPPFNGNTSKGAPVSGSGGGGGGGAQPVSKAKVASSAKINGGLGAHGEKSGGLAASNRNATAATMNVANSSLLLSLLDTGVPSAGGKITVPASSRTTHSNNSNAIDANTRLSAGRGTVDPRSVRDRADNPTTLASARSVGL